jgi:uncharacterized protein YceH (UPF0502 family)
MANPGRKPKRTDADKTVARTVEVFDREFTRQDGRKYSVVTPEALDLFDQLVAAGDADQLAIYMENPTQMLMSVLFGLQARVKDLENTVLSLSTRVDALERRPR